MKRSQQGLTIVELMVAIVLATIIIAGIVQVFLSNRLAFHTNEALIRIQENGRFGVSTIATALRQSGSYGCTPEFEDQNNIVSHTASIPEISPVQFTAASGLPATANGVVNAVDALDENDSITILVNTKNQADITVADNTAANPTLNLKAGGNFRPGQLALVSNCQVADYIGLGTGTDASKIVNDGGGLRKDFYARQDMPSKVTEVEMMHFFVENESLRVSYLSGGSVTTEDQLGGIENLQVEYGVDTNADLVVDYYTGGDIVASENQTENIISVKLHLLAVSGEDSGVVNVTSEPQTIAGFHNKDDLIAPDRRMRKIFQTTVSLRNRLD